MLAQSPPTTSLYDRDYAMWLETTIEQLRQQDFDQVDWENVLDEFESMSKRDRRSVESNLVILLIHLLRGCLKSRRRYKTFILTFGAYSESSQYRSLLPLTQAVIHSPEPSVDHSLTSQTFVQPPIVSVTKQTAAVPWVEGPLEGPNAGYP